MKRFHPLLLTALCLLAACDPSPPSSNPQRVALEPGSRRTLELTSTHIVFTDQKVCDSSTSSTKTVEVYNEDTKASRQINFVEASAPFALMSIEDSAHATKSLPFTLLPGKSLFFVLKFDPRVPADYSGFLKVFFDGSSTPLEVPLSGKGTGARLELSPASLTLSLPTGGTGASDAGVSDAGVPDDAGTPLSSHMGAVILKNSGNVQLSTLSLGSVSSSFSTQLSKSVLNPGETTSLVVTYAPTTSEPIVTETLVVASDDPCSPSSRIALTGFRSSAPAPVVTPTVLTFADQEVGTLSAPQSVKVLNGGGSVLTVDSLSLQGAGDAGTPFVVSPSGAFSLQPGESRDVAVKFSPTVAGHQNATLQLASSGGGAFPPVALSGDAVDAAPLTLGAASITFSDLKPGKSQQQTVTVTNPGPSPVTVNAAVSSAETSLTLGVSPASFTLGVKESRTLVVTATPSTTASTSSWSGQLTLKSGVSSLTRQTTLLLLGNTVRARIDPSSTTLTFADQRVGASPQTLELILKNPTVLPVTVNTVSADTLGTAFSITGLPVTIPANTDRRVTVSFNPASRKQWTATLQLDSDASDTIASVTLTGKAIAPVLSLNPTELNFGPQVPGTRVSKSVTVTNTGDADFTLSKLQGDSTLFSVEGLNPPQTVKMQGGTLSFNVVYTPSDQQGEQRTTLQFYEGTTALDSPQLKLSGTSSSPMVSFTPSTSLDFGIRQVADPAPIPKKVTLSNASSAYESLELVSVSIENGSTEFSLVNGPYTGLLVNAGSSLDVSVNFTPSSLAKASYTDSLAITYRGAITKKSDTVHIPLLGTVATAVMSVVDKLSFGAVERNYSKRLKLDINNKGNSPIHLSTISIEAAGTAATSFLLGALEWPKDVPAGGTETIYLDFKPTTLDVVSAQLVITSTATSGTVDPKTGKTVVILSGQGGVARASFSRRNIGFGEVPIGASSSGDLTITNTGSLPLRVSTPTSSSIFSVTLPASLSWPLSIDSQDSVTMKIVFMPSSATPPASPAAMTFTSNDQTEPSVAITLDGVGTSSKLTVVNTPPLEFGDPVKDAGSTSFKQLAASLSLKNEGKAPLVIKSLSTQSPFCIFIPASNTCVQTLADAALLSLVPVLATTEQKSIELRVTPASEGRTEGTLTLTTNEAVNASTTVKLGVGRRGVSVPTQAVIFGTCAMEEPTAAVEQSITVSNDGTAEDAITAVTIDGPDRPDFEVVNPLVSTLPLPVGGLATVKLRFKPGKGSAGQRTATVHIKTSSGPVFDRELQGVATGTFSGFEDFQWTVDFGTQHLSRTKVTKRFHLQNQLARPIYVKTYTLEGAQKGDFELAVDESCRLTGSSPQEIEIRVGETCDLLLSYGAGQVGLSHADLVLEAWTREGDARIPATRVKLSGEMVSSILSVDPPVVDFGWVDLGQAIEPRLLTVTNRSSIVTRVLVPEVVGSEVFTVEALEPGKELPPGGTTQLRVSFQPREGGDVSGKLQLRLQGDQEPDLILDLKGQVREVTPEGGGCSSGASEGGALGVAGGLLLMALAVRRRSRHGAP